MLELRGVFTDVGSSPVIAKRCVIKIPANSLFPLNAMVLQFLSFSLLTAHE